MGTAKHGDLIYDIGLHKGEDTMFYLRKGFRVVAVEADPGLVQICREKFSDFIAEGRLTIVEGAIVDPAELSDGRNMVTFFRNEEVSVWGTMHRGWAERNVRRGSQSQSSRSRRSTWQT